MHQKFHVENGDLHVQPSLLDNYAERQSLDSDCDFSQLNFIQFISQYFVKDSSLKRRAKPVTVRTFPTYSSNPRSQYYGQFCKYQLLTYKPWLNQPSDAWNDEEEDDLTFISHWNQFLQTEEGQSLVPNWSREIDTILTAFQPRMTYSLIIQRRNKKSGCFLHSLTWILMMNHIQILILI